MSRSIRRTSTPVRTSDGAPRNGRLKSRFAFNRALVTRSREFCSLKMMLLIR